MTRLAPLPGALVAAHGLFLSTGPVFFAGLALAVGAWLVADCWRTVR